MKNPSSAQFEMPAEPGLLPSLGDKDFPEFLEVRLLAEGVPVRCFTAGETIFKQGDSGDAAYFIRSGSINITGKGLDGRERTLNRLEPGELFGEMALLDQAPRSATAIATTDGELLVIPQDEVAVLLQHVPQLSLWMLGLFSRRLRFLTGMISRMDEVHNLNLKILAGQEEERRRIGREIHDGVAQSFVACITKVQIAQQQLDKTPERVRFELDDLEDGLRDGLNKLRDLVYNLYPKWLERIGLVGAIERFVERVAQANDLAVVFTYDGAQIRLPPVLESALYYIVQEGIHNVVRHAEASKVTVDLLCSEKALELVIEDNGKGFDLAAVRAGDTWHESIGLLSMDERAKLAGGDMELSTGIGQGTRLHFRLPAPAHHVKC